MDSSRTEHPAAVDLRQYHDKVVWLAARLHSRYQLHTPLEDLVGAGFVALYDRVKYRHDEYDPTRATFWAFVSDGIEGAMWQEVARGGISRKAYAFAQANSTAAASAMTADDLPTDLELIRDFLTIAENTRMGFHLFMHSPPPRAAAPESPEERVAARELRDRLGVAIEALPVRQRTIIRHRYHEGLSLTDIAAKFGISESRVAHTIREALNTLRANLD